MTIAPPEPAQEPTSPGEDEPTVPDLPDPGFPEVLPGGDPGPGEAPEPETQPDQS